jgi:hypothetical protein
MPNELWGGVLESSCLSGRLWKVYVWSLSKLE